MRPVYFDEYNVVIAKHQPPYLPLPAYQNETATISCWRLTWRERWLVLTRGVLWLSQLNFGQALQPQKPGVEKPPIP